MYGINLIIYVGTNQGLRSAFTRFLLDIYLYSKYQTTELPPEPSQQTSIWWIEMRRSGGSSQGNDVRKSEGAQNRGEEVTQLNGENAKRKRHIVHFLCSHFVSVLIVSLSFFLFILMISFLKVILK